MGSGYHSLVKQLQARIENVKRSSTPRIKKRVQMNMKQMKSQLKKGLLFRTHMVALSGT